MKEQTIAKKINSAADKYIKYSMNFLCTLKNDYNNQ